MLLHYGGMEFTETRVLRQEWLALKPSIEPLQQLPVLDVDGKRMHQSGSIARYLGKQVGLAGDNEWESYEIDAVADTVMDFRHEVAQYYIERDPVRKKRIKEKLDNDKLPFYLGTFEAWAEKNNGYLANGKLSWADLYFDSITCYLSHFIKEELITDKYPNLLKVRANVYATPGIKEWVDRRPKDDFWH